ncbi:hypothetical protein LX36DRAFT_672736 [Colletotrichum falcatum]|nr:hypothetical protein LX36DRAFT_672736 [Colletotrichum falcatum]
MASWTDFVSREQPRCRTLQTAPGSWPAPATAATAEQRRESVYSQEAQSAPPTPSSRHTQSSLSSVGSIPDFPLPAIIPPPPPPPAVPPRRSFGLGPPPSSRRGDSSFYSNASFVSPIPEESPRSRSHTSFASSAAMPESWGSQSPGYSQGYPGDYYDDAYSSEEEDEDSQMSRRSGSPYGGEGDESKLVRNASVGKMSKPSIVMHRVPSGGDPLPQDVQVPPRPSPSPMKLPVSPFDSGTAYYEGSSSSGTIPTMAGRGNAESVTPNMMLGAVAAASATDLSETRKFTPSPRPFDRLSAIRRPPKLDMDSVREMESRGSMTSLPDLIKRATRLAALIDRGRRPASRFEPDDGTWPDEKAFGREGERQMSIMSSADKHQSGLSDMLAAFPPPAATTPNPPVPTPPNRISWFRRASTASWPLAPGSRGSTPQPVSRAMAARGPPMTRLESNDDESSNRRRRRCCGLPLWAFIVIVVIVLGLIAAAVVVPLEFFVFRRNRASAPPAEPALSQCQNQLKCENGGTNVISQGVCSCICINGFTGQTCTVAGATGCTTTNLQGGGTPTSLSNVTLGQAIPRLLQQAQANFSIPLDGTDILAKLNTENLSCIAQNSLVTFDGRSSRAGTPVNNAGVINNAAIPIQIITLLPGQAITLTLGIEVPTIILPRPSPDIMGGFTTLSRPFRVTTISASSSTIIVFITAADLISIAATDIPFIAAADIFSNAAAGDDNNNNFGIPSASTDRSPDDHQSDSNDNDN